MFCITREDSHQEDDCRNDTKLDGGRESVKRKEKTRHRGRDCGDQKPFGPTVETFAGEQSEQNDEAGKNCDQAEQCVNDRVDVQYHLVTPPVAIVNRWLAVQLAAAWISSTQPPVFGRVFLCST